MKKVPIIILHGWGLSGKKFAPLSAEFKKRGYEVYAPDLPGFGEEKPPSTAWTLSDYAHFVHEFIHTKKLQNTVFIGHSFGGRVSLKFSFLYPKEISALILTGAPGYSPVSRGKVLFYVMIAKIGAKVFTLPLLSKIKDTARLWLYYVAGARDFYRANPTMREVFKKIIQERLDEPMKKLRIPSLLIWGEHDGIVPTSIAERMNNTIKHSKLVVVPNADHRVPYMNADIFSKHVVDFVEKL